MRTILFLALFFVVVVVAVVIIIVLFLGVIDRSQPPQGNMPVHGVTPVDWLRISPPPGFDGPCYTFVLNHEHFVQTHYTGIICK